MFGGGAGPQPAIARLRASTPSSPTSSRRGRSAPARGSTCRTPGAPFDQHRAPADRDAADIGDKLAHAAGSDRAPSRRRACHRRAVAHGQRAVMRFGDGARDGEAEPDCGRRNPRLRGAASGSGSKTFSRASSGMPGPSSQTDRLRPVRAAAHRDRDRAAGRARTRPRCRAGSRSPVRAASARP